jgi:hypothetical protein
MARHLVEREKLKPVNIFQQRHYLIMTREKGPLVSDCYAPPRFSIFIFLQSPKQVRNSKMQYNDHMAAAKKSQIHQSLFLALTALTAPVLFCGPKCRDSQHQRPAFDKSKLHES